MNEVEFKSWAAKEGFAEIGFKENADVSNEPHTHDRTAAICITCGNFGLEVDGERKNFGPGDHFTLAGGTLHREIFDKDGVAYFFAWKA